MIGDLLWAGFILAAVAFMAWRSMARSRATELRLAAATTRPGSTWTSRAIATRIADPNLITIPTPPALDVSNDA